MPQDYSVSNTAGIAGSQIGHGRAGQRSNFAGREGWRRGLEIKRRALIFAGLFVLVFLVLLALFRQGVDSGGAAQNLVENLGRTGTGISWRQVPALCLLGIGAGLLGGMLGLGGGVLKVAGMLLLFKLDIFFVRAVSLTTMFVTTASAAWPYAKRKFPLWQIIRSMIPAALVGVLAGLFLGSQVKGATLTHIFGFFVLFLGLYTLGMVFSDPKEHVLKENFLNEQSGQYQKPLLGSIGALHGFICGLLGISGGVISVPMQQLLLNMPVHHAIANTLVVSALCSGLGSIIVIATGVGQGIFSLEHILFAVLWIGGGAVLGAHIGVHMGLKSNSVILRLCFVVISFGASLSLLI